VNEPVVIRFSEVTKSYPCYNNVTGGIKTFLFNLGQSIRDLRRRSVALEGLSFDIHRGEAFGLIGANGAGKSTSLGLIAGVLFPDKGTVEVHGRVSPLLQLGAGFHPELTGRENILLNGVLLGLNIEQVRERQDEIIEFSTLGHFIDQPVRTYSSGMYAKLGFSVVANLNPEILLIDEILSVGDLAFTQRCMDCMARFRSDPMVTMVLVSHALSDVARICDRAAWIENHHLRMIGPAAEVTDAYRYSVTPKTMVGAQLEALPQYLLPSREELDFQNGAATLGIRTSEPAAGQTLDIQLYQSESQILLRHWVCPLEGDTLTLEFQNGEDIVVEREGNLLDNLCLSPGQVCEGQGRVAAIDADIPLTLEITLRQATGEEACSSVSLPMSLTAKARRWHEERRAASLMLARPRICPQQCRAPLWSRGRTLHIMARNIFPQDAVGRFSLDIGGLFAASGMDIRVYAYTFPRELAGAVLPVGRLLADAQEQDVLFYNYSILDEFLPRIVRLPCTKVLYYHNVTPGDFFREYEPDFATLLDNSRRQFSSFAHFQAVVANSHFSLDEIRKTLDENIFQGIHPPMLSPTGLETTAPGQRLPDGLTGKFLLWVGRIVPHKRPDFALRLFELAAARLPHCDLIVVGGGYRDSASHAAHLDALLAALPPTVRERVHFFESLSLEQLRAFYEHASALLCTSLHEGFGMPLYEAMRFGLPILATQAPGSEETLAGAGQLLPESLQEAADELVRVLTSPESLAELGERATQRGRELAAIADGTILWDAVEAAIRPTSEGNR